MINNRLKIKNKQNGAVLLVSMVILVALTMLGVTSMKGALTELTMAGNLRESGLTFQAAEAGLKAAETLIENSTSTASFGGSVSLLGVNDEDPDYLAATSWDTATEASVTLGNISTNPLYIIRYLGARNTDENTSIAIGDYGGPQIGKVIENFRVTSRASGQTGNFFRVVQSYYGKEYL